mmetsp:Transcript_128534/g.312414  ORF Transcript_128534/g.312414 Transcript_128534/m.312414 type:complete len:178 (-) Transcript_128534:89-622(-)
MGNCNNNGCTQDEAEDEEPDMSSDPKTVERVQAKIDRCLYWHGGLPFNKHQATMKQSCNQVIDQVARILRKHPVLGLKVLGYTGELPPDQALQLSHQRSQAIKTALHEAGADNLIAAKGMGYNDEHGPRIELVPCEAREVSVFMAEVQAAERKLNFLSDPRSCSTQRSCSTNNCNVQ